MRRARVPRPSPLLPVPLFLAATLALSALACGQDDDPEGARVLWEKINAGPGFRSWPRAPGYATRRPSFTAHKDAVEIFVSAEIARTLQPEAPPAELPRQWPLGSVIVKEGYSGGSRKIVAAMEKRADGWFWAEYDDGGGSLFSGRPSGCVDCHGHRESYSDWVYAFELPR
jgi:hypothetical protein